MNASHRCPDFPELEAMLDLPPSAPERQALEACPRCRARLAVLAEFLTDDSRPEGARLADAGPRLRRAFEAELEAAAGGPRPERSRPSAMQRFWGSRLSWGLAASFTLAALVLGGRELWLEPQPAQLVRGDRAGGETGLELLPVITRPDGALILRWRPAPGATSYRVQLLDAGLAPIAEEAALADTLLLLPPGALPAASGDLFGWQVTALQDGATLAVSGVGVFGAP